MLARRYRTLMPAVILLTASCAAAGAYLAVSTWNVFANTSHTFEDAKRVMADPNATPQERDGARFIINREVHCILELLRADAHPQSEKLLGNFAKAAGK